MRWRLAARMAEHLPYSSATIERVLELALETSLDDPGEFLRRCASVNLDPIETISQIRRIQRTG
jgi:hypothetical protein